MKQMFCLRHAEARRRALIAVGEAEDGMVVTVRPPTRSSEQNAKLHALLTDISRSVQWAGAYRDVECWKRLVTAAWMREEKKSCEILPAIDGHGVDLVYAPTSQLSTSDMSSLIEYATAWAVMQGVEV